MPKPNARVSAVAGSATLGLAARAQALRSSGVDIISMAVGEPDFPAPASVRAAAHAAIDGNDVRYTPAAGRPSLRAAVARHVSETRAIDLPPTEVCICHSAKHALSNALFALVEPDDEVLLLLPAWSSYGEEVRIAGGRPVPVPPREDLGPDFAALARAIGPRTRGLMVNSPTNPSGYLWTRAEIESLCELAEEHDLWILSDEIYRRLVYEGEPAVSPASISPAARARTVIVDGASKSFAMTGYRIGFLAGSQPLVDAVANLQSQVTGCPNAVSQAAYEVALTTEPPEVAQMVAEYDERRRFLVEGLANLGLEVVPPRGAYYVFPDVTPYLDGSTSAEFGESLLEEEALVVVPGSEFGMEGHIRLSYATSRERIAEALERLGRFLGRRS